MHVVRFDAAPPYAAPGHEGMRMVRLQGREAGPADLVWLGVSTIEPGGGATLSASEVEKMYVVLDGRVLISKFIPGAGEEALAFLERGDFFGEMALIDNQPRSADARAHDGEAVVLGIPRGIVDDLLDPKKVSSLRLLKLLASLLSKRLRELDDIRDFLSGGTLHVVVQFVSVIVFSALLAIYGGAIAMLAIGVSVLILGSQIAIRGVLYRNTTKSVPSRHAASRSRDAEAESRW